MEVMDIGQAAGSLFFASLLVLVTFFVALRLGYFRLPVPGDRPPVTILQTIGVFLTYVLLAFLVVPLINALIINLLGKQNTVSQTWLGWAQIVLLYLVFFCLLGYGFLIKREALRYIFWGDTAPSKERAAKSVVMGFVSFIVSYPFVFWMGIFTSLISLWLWNEAKIEQVAVKQLKLAMGHPVMFSFMVFLVVILVPFMEELLFRGFLQSMLKRYLGRMGSLFVTAIIFASVHFAPSQGLGNFQLIASLFILSIFLGFIYERERTLWAPITLHAAFNGFTVLMIIFS